MSAAPSGPRSSRYADYALVLFASKALGGRPVKWIESRRENYRQHDPRPRPHHLSRDRRHARRRDHRAPGQDPGQPRRPAVDDRTGHPDDALRPGPERLLQDPERLLRGHRRLHQHGVRRRVPRRRPARGDLRRRAGDGPLRGRDRDGPRRDPAAELHRPGQVPVRQPVRSRDRVGRRQDLHRLGQLRAGARQGAGDGRLRRHGGGQGGGPQARQVPRHRPVDLHRGLRRRAVEVDRRGRRGLGRRDVGIGQHQDAPDRQDRGHRRHLVARPGPRDDVLADHRPRARHPDGGHRRPALGHAGHPVRLRHVRQPDLVGRQHRGDQGRRQDPREGPPDGRPHARGVGRRHRGRRRQLLRQGQPRPGQDDPGDRLRDRPRVRPARGDGAVSRRDGLSRHPELHVAVRDAHRDRRDRRARPARSSSSATSRSTMSARRSTR